MQQLNDRTDASAAPLFVWERASIPRHCLLERTALHVTTEEGHMWSWLLRNAGALVAAAGLFLTVWQLRRNHDWNRREYAGKMAADWNEKTSAHRRAIERVKPGLIDADAKGQIIELTKQQARDIYCSTPRNPDEGDLWELRFHFVELLNHMEAIA